ncbi:dihydrofolate reductase family protein [Actinomadura rugatobispora]|uniref:Dihydrofolate reductase family protein n=1 Tax=Actinomadura rugatobispora TaxID=1994 RepID=A0ABW1A4R9_9ACTN|nr:dihydrofolate reductase family protein [Actinomadura rugatobispora]
MGKVIYWMNTSIDGYIADPDGGMDFMEPAEDFRLAANDHVRRITAFLFGRRLFEAMEKPWTQDLGQEGAPAIEREFAQLYKETPRYVFSDTLQTVPEGVTIVRRKDAVSAVTRLKQEIDGTLQLGGPELAASLVDLIDEFWVYTFPVIIGEGRPYLPVGKKLLLRPVEHRSFASGTTFRRYVRS